MNRLNDGSLLIIESEKINVIEIENGNMDVCKRIIAPRAITVKVGGKTSVST